MGQRWFEVFLVALRLGLTSFGGPFAHLGYFHHEYVVRRRWVDEAAYADLVALCQFLPGPTSSQLGMALGRHRAGVGGAVAAWLGFTLPSALVLVALAGWWATVPPGPSGLVTGLEAAAFAVVAVAAWSMATKLSAGRRKAAITLAAAGVSALVPGAFTQPALLAAAGLAALVVFPPAPPTTLAPAEPAPPGPTRSPPAGWPWLVAWGALLVALPVAAWAAPSGLVILADGFFRAGSLVFGGGHVVLPLMRTALVGPGLLDPGTFLAGYGFAQLVPGPLFSVAGFWGWAAAGPGGAVVSLVFLFLPSFLLIFGVLPAWTRWSATPWVRRALTGVNAAVVGILAWTLVDPLGVQALGSPAAAVLAAALVVAHGPLKAPTWAVVAAGALVGVVLGVL